MHLPVAFEVIACTAERFSLSYVEGDGREMMRLWCAREGAAGLAEHGACRFRRTSSDEAAAEVLQPKQGEESRGKQMLVFPSLLNGTGVVPCRQKRLNYMCNRRLLSYNMAQMDEGSEDTASKSANCRRSTASTRAAASGAKVSTVKVQVAR